MALAHTDNREPLLLDAVRNGPCCVQRGLPLLCLVLGLGCAVTWVVSKDHRAMDPTGSMAAVSTHPWKHPQDFGTSQMRQPFRISNSMQHLRSLQQASQAWQTRMFRAAQSIHSMASAEKVSSDFHDLYEAPAFTQFFDFRGMEEKFDAGNINLAKALLFQRLRNEASQLMDTSLVKEAVQKQILEQDSLSDALVAVLTARVTSPQLSETLLREMFKQAIEGDALDDLMCKDLVEMMRKDPAIRSTVMLPFFFMKGFQAVQLQRISHTLWLRQDFESRVNALALQSRMSEVFGVDLHPGAKLGPGLFLDHATGVVIGETATMGERCTILHGVTLGSTGRPEPGLARHPQIGDDVVLGTGSTVLGNIHVGARSVIAAGAIVTQPVADGKTVVGINKVLDKSLAVGEKEEAEVQRFDI